MLWYFGFFSQPIEQLKLAILLDFLLLNTVDLITDIIDIISEENTCEEWDNNDKEGFNAIVCMQVAKADSQDYGCSEVIAPDVLLVPCKLIDCLRTHPVIARIDLWDWYQDTGKQMANEEVQAHDSA